MKEFDKERSALVILTKREVMRNKENKKKYCFDIIYEWENIMSEMLKCPIMMRSKMEYKFDEMCRRLYATIELPVFWLFRLLDPRKDRVVFMYDGATKRQNGIYNYKKYIPCLIDYFLGEEQYSLFLKAYKNNQMVLVSSREVYEYLLEKKCPLKIEHLALSIPDFYVNFDVRYEKKYDLVLFARQNPLLIKYVDEYEKTHKDFNLVRRKYENGHYIYYLSQTGEAVSLGDTREEYWNLVKMSKIALYTTPGSDGTRTDANGWNQVTPHFLEEVAGQCHIIARYPDNADTRWYEMSKICDCVKDYEEFEKLMDKYRNEEVDLYKYEQYLKKHVTSNRAETLKQILKENNLL